MSKNAAQLKNIIATVKQFKEFEPLNLLEMSSSEIEIPKEVDTLIKHLLVIWLEEKEKRLQLEQRLLNSKQYICEGMELCNN